MGLIALSICFLGFLLTLFLSITNRLNQGVSRAELARYRYYEILPLRVVFWSGYGLIWAAFVFSIVLAALAGLACLNQQRLSVLTVMTTLVAGALIWPLLKCRRWFRGRVLDLPRDDPPGVHLENASFSKSIETSAFETLGCERFPNHVAPERFADQKIRWGIVMGILAFLLLGFSIANRAAPQSSPHTIPVTNPDDVRPVPQKPVADQDLFWQRELALLVLLMAGVPLALLLYDNRDYTFVPFRTMLLIKAVLFLLLVAGVLLWTNDSGALFSLVPWISLVIAVRLIADIRLSWRYDRMKRVYNPIAEKLRELAPYLPRLTSEPGYDLPALSVDALHQRMSQGCKNVEERGILVTRHLSRFLGILRVEYQDCAMVMLRYLTWRRYVTLSGGSPTWGALRHPEVPWWDLQLFPLYPASGFIEWTDPLGLGSEYDVVALCGTCGGRGTVTRTITETQNNQTVSRQVEETCSGCSGSGRLIHQQILNTQWQRLLPLVTHPNMQVSELVEDAEDVTYVHAMFTEHREPVPLSAKTNVPRGPILTQIAQTIRAVSALHAEHSAMVEKLHDGYLYRADFQVCGYRTIRIRFERLPGSVGWFFGRRPEFYFPRLPLSWSAVATCVFFPPLALAFAACLLAAASFLVQRLTG